MIKTIVDLTLLVHMRHQFQLGGLYWSGNMVLNQAFCFVAVVLYKKCLAVLITNYASYRDESVGELRISPRCDPTDEMGYDVDFVCEESG